MIHRQRRSLKLALALGCATASAPMGQSIQNPQTGPALQVTPLKASCIYAIGETAGWKLSLSPGQTFPGKIAWVVKRNNFASIQSGEIDPSSGESTIQITGTEPEMLMLQLTIPGESRPRMFGAAVAPLQLKPVAPKPRDFDSFWKEKISALERVPPNPEITSKDSGRPDVEYSTIRMDHLDGTHVYGQLAKPKRAGKFPAMLILQWASPPYPLDKSWVLNPASQGWLALNIEPQDVPTDAPASFYSSLPTSAKHYEAVGQEDRDQSYFVKMYLRDYRAVDYLAHCPDWDGKTILVTGGSMGGQQSLCVAGLYPKITHVIVEEPAGCDLAAGLHGRQEGYPFFSVSNPKVMETARYVDAVNFASRIHATCLVAMGFKDDVAPPAGIWTAFNQIKGPKEVVPLVNAPHNNLATYQEQLPYYRRSGEWQAMLLKGQKIVPQPLEK